MSPTPTPIGQRRMPWRLTRCIASRQNTGVFAAALLVAAPFNARAEPRVVIAAGGGLPRLAVEADSATVRVCGSEPCTKPVSYSAPGVDLRVVSIGKGRRLVHARGADDWEALFAGGVAPLFLGPTGYVGDIPGERTGTRLVFERQPDGTERVLLARVREDLRLCGQEWTLLEPRVLDPATLAFRPSPASSTLPGAQRTELDASPQTVESPLAELLVATGPTGRGRSKVGFITVRAPADISLLRLAVVLTEPLRRPTTMLVTSNASVFQVKFAPSALKTYSVVFPAPVKTHCLSVVAGEGPAVADLRAYSVFDGPQATLDGVAERLGEPEAGAVLKRAGLGAFEAVQRRFDQLPTSQRVVALDVAAAVAPCEVASSLYVRGLLDPALESTSQRRLERCGKQAGAALVDAFETNAEGRARIAPLLGSLAPERGRRVLVARLGESPRNVRIAVRNASFVALRGATKQELQALLAAERSDGARVELLRAMGQRLAEVRLEAGPVLERLLGSAMETRYVLVAPVVELARVDEAWWKSLERLLLGDPEGAVRTRVADALGAGPAEARVLRALSAATSDREPRVRQAAYRSIMSLGNPTGVGGQGLGDRWTFVRKAAVGALGAAPPGEADRGLVVALGDRASVVRLEAAQALGERRGEGNPALQARLADLDEEMEVRAAAAWALGARCDSSAVERLTELVQRAPGNDAEVTLLAAAVAALGRLHPVDLAQRLGPLGRGDAGMERLVKLALSESRRCP